MIIDAHAHIFPNWKTDLGYEDPHAHLREQQNRVKRFWGRMVTNTLDSSFIPLPDEEVNFRVGKCGRFYWNKNGRECWQQRFPSIMTEMEWTPEQLIAFMDEIGVEKALLQAGYMEINFCRRHFHEAVRKWPDRFLATLAIDYDITNSRHYLDAELEKMRTGAQQQGMKGAFQSFPREQDPTREEFTPFWKELASLEIPHIFLVGFQPREDYLKYLGQIETVLKKFPDVKGIIGHLGGNVRPPNDPIFANTPEELLNYLRLPNAYFEVGYVLAYENWEVWGRNYEYPYPLHTELIKRIYHEVGADRLIWGSDIPNIYRTCTYRQCLDLVRLHFEFLSAEEKDKVLGGNAARLFKVAP